MGIFQRISDIFKSNVNDLIDRAEDPEKMVKQVIIDMQAELTKSTQALGKAVASERMAEKQYNDAVKRSASFEAKAKTALASGNQELAKKALEQKVKADSEVATYKEMHETISNQTDAIREQVETLKAKLQEAKSKEAMLIARSQMADTQKELAQATSGIGTNNSFDKFNRMEEKVARKEAEAQAFTEIAGYDGIGADDADSFEELEKNAKVDSELQRLMTEMGMAQPAPEVPAEPEAQVQEG